MSFIYDHYNFNAKEQYFISEAIELDKRGKFFNILTKLKDDGSPSYTVHYMHSFINVYKETNSIEAIEKMAILNKNKEPVYELDEIFIIEKGHKTHLSQESIDIYAKLDSNNKSVFDAFEMEAIYQGFRLGLTKDEVMIYARLDKDGASIYNHYQMDAIRHGLVHGLSKDEIDIYARLDKNMVPIYTSEEMNALEYFLQRADDKQVQQLKDSIVDGLTFDQFGEFINLSVPAEKMRIYRSLYQLDYDEQMVSYIIDQDELTYDELKKLKYLLTCAKKLNELDISNKCKDPFPYKKYINKSIDFNNMSDLIERLSYNIVNFYFTTGKVNTTSMEPDKTIEECFKRNMDPEVIHFLMTSGYNKDEINHVASLLFDGADFNKIRKLREEAADILGAEEINNLFETNKDSNKEL